MKSIIYFFALLLPLLAVGCEKTIHEVNSPVPMPNATMALR
jgi:hypothetical protein